MGWAGLVVVAVLQRCLVLCWLRPSLCSAAGLGLQGSEVGLTYGHHSSSFAGSWPLEPQCWMTDKMMRVGTPLATCQDCHFYHFSSLFLYGCYFQRFPGSFCFPSNESLNAPGKRMSGGGTSLFSWKIEWCVREWWTLDFPREICLLASLFFLVTGW